LELLKDQVGNLETNVQKIKDTALTHVIFDTELYIHHLTTVKAALMSRKCVVVISQNGDYKTFSSASVSFL
jgi:hypothetical protein